MAKFNFFKNGLALLVLTLFIVDVYSVPTQRDSPPKQRTYEEIKKDKLRRALEEVTTPGECLSDDTINFFIELVNKQYKGTFEMLDIVLYQTPEFYGMFAKNDTDDVQILYGGPVNRMNSVGHYICIFYKHSEHRVYVYDPLFTKHLTSTQHQIVKDLYPLAEYIKYVKPQTKQPDASSCGVFSIAYATSLIFGENPKTKQLPLAESRDRSMPLREHIKKMLLTQTVTPFN